MISPPSGMAKVCSHSSMHQHRVIPSTRSPSLPPAAPRSWNSMLGKIANLSLPALTETGPQIDPTSPDPDGPEPPVLTITSDALTVNAGGSVSLPISVTGVDSDDTISVTIRGLTRYETVTDNLDNI